MSRAVKIASAIVLVVLASFVAMPFVNDFRYDAECGRMLAAAQRLQGLTSAEAVQNIRKSDELSRCELSEGEDSILLISPNEYVFFMMTGIPAVELKLSKGRVVSAQIDPRGKAI